MNSPQIISRRSFLSHAGTLGLGTALATLTDIPLVMQRALANGSIGQPGANGRVKKLLFIFLRGANDGLNTVIPHGDDSYGPSIRKVLEIKRDPANPVTTRGRALFPEAGSTPGVFDNPYGLPLGNGFAALHPSLKFLGKVYNDGDLAIVHRVGYPKQSRSHFDSQSYWETGVPNNNAIQDGVLYRAMVESGLANTAPLTGVSIGSSLPLILRGSKAAMTNVNDPTRFNLLSVPNTPAGLLKNNAALATADAARFVDKRDRDLLQLQYQNLTETLKIFANIDFSDKGNTFTDDQATDGDTEWFSQNGHGYYLFPASDKTNGGWQRKGSVKAGKFVVPTDSYDHFRSLKAAALVLNKTDAIVSGVSIDGWDTHNNQVNGANSHLGNHANLLRRVGWSVFALQKYFSRYGDRCHWEDLVVVTLSEFGRTTIENSNIGTDHAEASVMFVAGGSVKGFQEDASGTVTRSGVFNCGGDGDKLLPWKTGAQGSMFQAEQRYLLRNTDYRSVMGKVIRDHLGATQDQLNRIIPGYAVKAESLKGPGIQARDGVHVIGEPDIV
jgi:uncharacterized protein (DUF1501 family)